MTSNLKTLFIVIGSMCGMLTNSSAQAQTYGAQQARLNRLQAEITQSQANVRMWQQARQQFNTAINQGQFQHNGSGGYVNRNGMGGTFGNQHQSYSGNAGSHQGGFKYQEKNGPSANGQYVTDGRGNFAAAGMYQNQAGYGYGGGVVKAGGSTNVRGNYQTPGTMPGTTNNYYAGGNLQGQKSSLYSGGSNNNASNGQRIGGTHNNLNGEGFRRDLDANFMNARANQSTGVRFQGTNSSFTHSRNVNAGGYVRQGYNVQANLHQVSGGANMQIGHNKFGVQGAVSSKGASLRVQTPRISVPGISTQNVKLPKMSTPKISTSKISRPSLSVGGRKVF